MTGGTFEALLNLGPILLEGPDGAGKTTLALQLLDQEPSRSRVLYRNGKPEPDSDLMMLYAQQLTSNAIIDRAWLSEIIYAPVLLRAPQLTPDDSIQLMKARIALNGCMVLCLPSFPTCRAAWAARPDEELLKTEDALLEVWFSYVEAAYEASAGRESYIYIYDWTKDSVYNLVSWLNTAQRKRMKPNADIR